MNLNNTSEPKKIVKRDINLGKFVSSGIFVFSLATLVFSANKLNYKILDSEEYGFYSVHYLENLDNVKLEDYDYNFNQIYDNVTYKCNKKNYSGMSIYIVSYDDGTVHLIDSDNRKKDLITNEPIIGKRTKIMPFKQSSVFYDLYSLGVIKDENVILSSDYLNVIAGWNGEKHYKTIDLVAERETSLQYQEKYGGKYNG